MAEATGYGFSCTNFIEIFFEWNVSKKKKKSNKHVTPHSIQAALFAGLVNYEGSIIL